MAGVTAENKTSESPKPYRDQAGRWTGGGHPSAWKRGQAPNPSGTCNAGTRISAHINALCTAFDEGTLTVSDLYRIRTGDSNPNRRIAAKLFSQSLRDDEEVSVGSKLDPGKDLDRIFDRTSGKPLSRNQVDVTQRIDLDAAKQFLDQIASKLGVVRGPIGDIRRVEAKVIKSIRSEVIHGV